MSSKQTTEVAWSTNLLGFPPRGHVQSRSIGQQSPLVHNGTRVHSNAQRVWNVEQKNWQQQTCCPQTSKRAHPRARQKTAARSTNWSNVRIQSNPSHHKLGTMRCHLNLILALAEPINRSLVQHLKGTRGRSPCNSITHEVGTNKETSARWLPFRDQHSRVNLLRQASMHGFHPIALNAFITKLCFAVWNVGAKANSAMEALAQTPSNMFQPFKVSLTRGTSESAEWHCRVGDAKSA